MADTDALRSALLGSKNARIEEVEIELGGVPLKFGVKQPSMGVQGKLLASLKRAAKAEDPEALNVVKVEFAINTVCDVVTGALTLNERDKAGLLSQPSASWIDKVYETSMRLMQSIPQKKCEHKDADGKVCGGELMLGAPKCPWCGSDVPSPAEVAEKNC